MRVCNNKANVLGLLDNGTAQMSLEILHMLKLRQILSLQSNFVEEP